MKKLILTLFLLLILPFGVKAVEVTNLQDALASEGIELSTQEYAENDNQVTLYLFRGSGCSHCHDFLEFLNNNLAENGYLYKVRSYEVWSNEENSELMEAVAKKLGTEADGVPFIVIGDKYYSGFSEDMGEEIINQLKSEYEKEEKVDVVSTISEDDLKNATKKNTSEKESTQNNTGVIAGVCIVLALIIGLIFYAKKKNKEVIE